VKALLDEDAARDMSQRMTIVNQIRDAEVIWMGKGKISLMLINRGRS